MNLQKSRLVRIGAIGAMALAATAISSQADAVIFNLSGISNPSGNPLSASAEFMVAGNTLTVVLTNTASAAAANGADVLDGVFFDIAGANPVMSNGQAALTAGSDFVLKNNAVPSSTNSLNDEWMFKSPSPAIAREYAISSVGFPGFNVNADSFDKVFHGGSGVASANDAYGIVPTLGITAGNSTNVYVRNSMTFTFDMDAPISESDIQNVLVSYGSNGQTVLVPEPASMAAVAVGFIALLRRRSRK